MARSELNERALPGVHEALFAAVLKHCPATGHVSALDLGAGEGAMCARLQEGGYRVEAVEIEEGRFQVENITCRQLDLNDDFARALDGTFDIITAVDVIEHLENHRHFLRNCRDLLSDRGLVFITSPNVECWNSRLIFLRHGMLSAFGSPGIEIEGVGGGHVTPLFSWQMLDMVRELDFEVVEEGTAGSRSDWADARMIGGGHLSFLGKTVLRVLLGPLMKGRTCGSTNLFVLRKRAHC